MDLFSLSWENFQIVTVGTGLAPYIVFIWKKIDPLYWQLYSNKQSIKTMIDTKTANNS